MSQVAIRRPFGELDLGDQPSSVTSIPQAEEKGKRQKNKEKGLIKILGETNADVPAADDGAAPAPGR